MDEASADLDEYDDSVEWFRSLALMTDAEFDELLSRARRRAFRVAGVAQLDLVTDVWDALDSAIAHGETLDDFKKAVATKLYAAWGGEQPWRVETIFRTNVQTAYSAGRYRALTLPSVKRLRPFWKYSAVMDSRTSPICAPLNGTVLPADAPFWDTHQPPLHHNCRSSVIALTEEQAQAEGIDEGPPDDIAPAAGFGAPPQMDEPDPDLDDYPVPLVAQYEEQQPE